MNQSRQSRNENYFYISPYAIDGESLGVGTWDIASLSTKWLNVCTQFLSQHGEVFDSNWPDQFSHIRTRFTSSSGAAIVTFYARDCTVSSILLLSGLNTINESEVSAMYVDSLIRSTATLNSVKTSRAFRCIQEQKARPNMVVVNWPHPTVTEQDQNIVRELGLHLAGAYFINKSHPKYNTG